MEEVFRALADPSRRRLLDRLFERDGQSLRELEAHLPEMSRFGVMKHLKVLTDAHLVVARRSGREKFHYLNAVPIQEVYDRWVSKYSQPWTRGLVALKQKLESPNMSTSTPPRLVNEIYIRTTPESVFQALTDGEITRQYQENSRIESDWTVGGSYVFRMEDGQVAIEGEVLAYDPPRRLQLSWRMFLFATPDHEVSTVTYEIEPFGETCRLTVLHEGLPPAMREGIGSSWNQQLSSLKSLLETGQPLVITVTDQP